MATNNIPIGGSNSNKTAHTPVITPVPAITPETIVGLLAVDIKTGLVNTTLSITKAGILSQTILLSTISSWYISGADLHIISDDNVPFTLSFTTAAEAIAGELRLAQIINGASLA